MKNTIKTEKQVRQLFWVSFPQYQKYYRDGKTQNSYKTDIRCAFVDFVDSLNRDGQISDELAYNVTL